MRSPEHLAGLVERCERRPFVEAEVRAGMISRVPERHPKRIGVEDLARETGLARARTELGVMRKHAESDGLHPRVGEAEVRPGEVE
ncbi:hypothetical protein ACWGI8_30770 [Streptomyces sp. NPDC054841]